MCFVIGGVYLFNNTQIYPEKYKYHVCVAVNNNIFFVINTEDHDIYKPSLKLSHKTYSFLNGTDRYLSCSSAFGFNNYELSTKKLIGKINHNDMLKIMEIIKISKTLTKIQKNIISIDWEENYS